MSDRFSFEKMLVLRKLTRSVGELVRGLLKEHLATLGFLFRPKGVFGEFVDGNKESVKGADAAFGEVKALYQTLAGGRLFNLPKELSSPITVLSGVPEISTFDYVHQAKTEKDNKTVTVTAPLKWVLSYSTFTPQRLKELQGGRAVGNELTEFVLHSLMMHIAMNRQPGLTKMLEALHFTITPGRLSNSGDLPITFISSTVPTIRPPDEVIIQNTEISGRDAFEEVVDLEAMTALRDPFIEKLAELAKQ